MVGKVRSGMSYYAIKMMNEFLKNDIHINILEDIKDEYKSKQ